MELNIPLNIKLYFRSLFASTGDHVTTTTVESAKTVESTECRSIEKTFPYF